MAESSGYEENKSAFIKTDVKICFLGSDGAGKTSIIRRKLKNVFSDSYLPTLGTDFYKYDLLEKNKIHKSFSINVWDIASQQSFSQIRPHFLSNSYLTIIVIDIDRTSDEYIETWVEEVKRDTFSGEYLFCLNKIDLCPDSEQYKKTIEKIEKKYNPVKVFATSAKSGENIDDLFNFINDWIIQKDN